MRFQRVANLFVWALALAPLTILLHELGHWVVAKASGFEPVLRYSAVSGIPEVPPFGGKPLGVAASALAGPLVSIFLTATGYLLWRRRPSLTWALALAFVAPVRFLINVMFLLVSAFVALGVVPRPSPKFDEMTVALALGLPVLPIVAVGAITLPLAWFLIIRRLGVDRWRSVAPLLAGTVVGIALWVGPVGQMLLP